MGRKKSQAEINDKLKDKEIRLHSWNNDLTTQSRVDLQCLKCNHIWNKPLCKVLYGKYGCPGCNLKHSHIKNYNQWLCCYKNIKIITTTYYTTQSRVDLQCLKCNHIWNKKLQSILYAKYSCPNCNYNFMNRDPQTEAVMSIPDRKTRLYIMRRARYLAAIYYKGGKCQECDFDLINNMECADFHHTNIETKDKAIGTLATYSWVKVLQEIDKCVLLCSNCHRKHHYNQDMQEEYKDIIEETKDLLLNSYHDTQECQS